MTPIWRRSRIFLKGSRTPFSLLTIRSSCRMLTWPAGLNSKSNFFTFKPTKSVISSYKNGWKKIVRLSILTSMSWCKPSSKSIAHNLLLGLCRFTFHKWKQDLSFYPWRTSTKALESEYLLTESKECSLSNALRIIMW